MTMEQFTAAAADFIAHAYPLVDREGQAIMMTTCSYSNWLCYLLRAHLLFTSIFSTGRTMLKDAIAMIMDNEGRSSKVDDGAAGQALFIACSDL